MPGMSLILDIVIIVLLGATIFYALRLSRHLDAFRSNRSDMERLIRELSAQITRAQEGVTALDDASRSSGDELRSLITKAQGLTDELSLMTEAGDSLAARLENLATRNRTIVDELGQTASNLVYPGTKTLGSATHERKVDVLKADEASPASLFAIRDPDFQTDRDDEENFFKEDPVENDKFSGSDDFATQAERDLAAALKRRKMRGDL